VELMVEIAKIIKPYPMTFLECPRKKLLTCKNCFFLRAIKYGLKCELTGYQNGAI